MDQTSTEGRQARSSKKHRIVIVGGGAGGLELACRLGKKAKKSKQFEVYLVDRQLTHVWKPLLHEIGAGTMDSNEDEQNFIALAYKFGFQFRYGQLIGLNRAENVIRLAALRDDNGEEYSPERDIYYDTLVMAIGSTANTFGTEGAVENCIFLDSREQADRFHRRLVNLYVRSSITKKPLSIAIVGAGATGVELAAELRVAARQAHNYGLKNLDPENGVLIHLIENADRVLPALPERLSKATEQELKKINVQLYTSERVESVTESSFKTASGKEIHADIKVWAAGIKAPDFLHEIDGLETTRSNQLVVTPYLQTKDENVYAMGDCASCLLPGHERPVAPRAQFAHQEAMYLSKALINKMDGKQVKPFTFNDYGSLVSLSRHSAVGSLMGNLMGSVMVEGFIARMMYKSLYKKHQLAINGIVPVILSTMANLIKKRIEPRLKLH